MLLPTGHKFFEKPSRACVISVDGLTQYLKVSLTTVDQPVSHVEPDREGFFV